MLHGEELAAALNVKVVPEITDTTHPSVVKGTVVLAHGFGCNQSVWDAVVPPLIGAKYRVVLFDWPGACTTDVRLFDGHFDCPYESFAGLLLDLLRHLGLIASNNSNNIIFVGHSMSAMIGCIAALSQRNVFSKLILVGASPRYLNDVDYYGGFEQEDLDQLYDAMECHYVGWASEFGKLVVGPTAGKSEYDTFRYTLCSMHQGVALKLAKAIFQSDFRSLVSASLQILPELHVLQTSDDIAVPLMVSDYLRHQLLQHQTSASCRHSINHSITSDGIINDVDNNHNHCSTTIMDSSTTSNIIINDSNNCSVLATTAAVPQLSFSNVSNYSSGIKGSVEVLQTCGHLPQLTAPELFTKSLLAHL